MRPPRGLLVCRRGDGCATRRRSLEFSARSKRSIAHDARAWTQWRRRGCSKMSRMSENERDRKMEKLNWIPFFLCNYQKLEILHTSVNTRNSVRYTRKHKQFITVAVSTFNLTVSRIHFTKILESFPPRKFRETSQIINHSGPGINLRLEYLLKRGNLSRFPTELGRCSRYKPVSICNYMHPPPLRYSQSYLFSRATVIFHLYHEISRIRIRGTRAASNTTGRKNLSTFPSGTITTFKTRLSRYVSPSV